MKTQYDIKSYRLAEETVKKLAELKEKDQSYNQLFLKLLEYYKNKEKPDQVNDIDLANQVNENTKPSKPPLPDQVNLVDSKETHIKETHINTISKDIEATPIYGNKNINQVIDFLEEQLGGSLDGSVKMNRQYAYLLLNRMKKDYPDKNPVEQIKALINFGLQDEFQEKNINGFRYLYNNATKIIQTTKSKLTNKIIKI